MPIYEYKCRACGEQIEVIQKLSDRPLRTCGSCGGRLEKLLSQTSFLLKGGGWYADGYAKKSGKSAGERSSSSASKSSDEPASKPASSTTSGSDSKPKTGSD